MLIFAFVLARSLSWALAPGSGIQRDPSPLEITQVAVVSLQGDLQERQRERGDSFNFFEEAEALLAEKGFRPTQDHPLFEVIDSRDTTSRWGSDYFDFKVFVHPEANPLVVYSFKRGGYKVLPEFFFPLQDWGHFDVNGNQPFYFQIYPSNEKTPRWMFIPHAVLKRLYASIGIKPERVPENFKVYILPERSLIGNARAQKQRGNESDRALAKYVSRFLGSHFGSDSFSTHVVFDKGVRQIPYLLVHELGHFLYFDLLTDEQRETFNRMIFENDEVRTYIRETYTDAVARLELAKETLNIGWVTRSDFFAQLFGVFIDQFVQHTRNDLTFSTSAN